jgi:hypothetical protein
MCAGMFIIMTVDMFRPAMFVSWPPIQNRESHQVIDFSSLAVNLGFAPTSFGGLIIMNMGYGGLFWVDGSSCIDSDFTVLVKERKNLPI